MLILLWLVPPAVITIVAAVVVGRIGHAAEKQVDRDRAMRRLGKALAEGRPAVQSTAAKREADHSTGIAVRRKAS